MRTRLSAVALLASALAAMASALPALADHEMMSSPAAAQVPLYTDLGKYHRQITTTSPVAQRYFDQGMTLVFGFNHAEAIRAFEQAIALDKNCAMAYWGKALALGPNINMPMDAPTESLAYVVSREAMAHATGVTPVERSLIQALSVRYAPAQGTGRAARDSAYSEAMRVVAKGFPGDDDAATLYAESVMDLSPWNNWTKDGKPLPGTEEFVATLERVLARNPNHPGANHYYIHAIEASPYPERGLDAANRLRDMVPGAGHLVHMPAHIYQRTGRYAESEAANARAEMVDSLYIAKENPQSIYPMMYYPHNVDFLWVAACMQGRSAEAFRAARKVVGMVTPEVLTMMPPVEIITPTLLNTYVRFGRWDAILREPAPTKRMQFAVGIWRYARGLAFNAKNQPASARTERDSLAAIVAAYPNDAMIGFNSGKSLLTIARRVLEGELAAKQGKTDEAIGHFTVAIGIEDSLHYDEPSDWTLPVRQNLGAVLLAAGRASDAEAAYRADLKINPENGWALLGLAKSLHAQKKDSDAAEADARFKKAWARADVQIAQSRY